MTGSAHISTLQNAQQTGSVGYGFFSIGWFVLLVVASGFLSFAQDLFVEIQFPVQLTLRLLLLLQILLVMILGSFRTPPLPSILLLPIVLLSISMIATPFLSVIGGADISLTLRAFYFMFGIGIYLVCLPFVPLVIDRIRLLPTFSVACVLFGTLQVLTQDLHLSDALRAEFGIVYDVFTNGRLRAVSFFASAPRFAEFLVFVLSWLLVDIISRGRFLLLKIMMYGFCIWLLINTYSRAGYILFIVSTAFIVFIKQQKILGPRDILGLSLRLVAVIGLALLLIFVADFVDFDRLEIADSTSLLARFEHWDILLRRATDFSFLQYLFGSGETAMFSRSEVEYFIVDNLYVALFLYSGLIGLSALLLLIVSTLRVALSELRCKKGSEILPVLALYVGLIVQGMFVDNHNTFFLAQLCIICIIRATRLVGGSGARKRSWAKVSRR